MDDGLIARIERAAGVPGLVGVLAGLAPTDLQSLLLAVYQRRTAGLTATDVLDRYRRDAYVAPSPVDPGAQAAFDARVFAGLAERGFVGVELSPVAPLGTVSVLGTVDQNNVLSTVRNNEVVSDSTNALALECAVRRRSLLRLDPRDRQRVRLYTSHRLVRGQRFTGPGLRQHFRLLALTTAGRDEGSFRFEVQALTEQLDALLHLLGRPEREVRVTVTDLSGGVRVPVLRDEVLGVLAQRYPAFSFAFDPERTGGREYYVDACFHIHVRDRSGALLQLGDGGFTVWTRALLNNAKERFLTGCVSTERLLTAV